jgi:hypothetical protein
LALHTPGTITHRWRGGTGVGYWEKHVDLVFRMLFG